MTSAKPELNIGTEGYVVVSIAK